MESGGETLTLAGVGGRADHVAGLIERECVSSGQCSGGIQRFEDGVAFFQVRVVGLETIPAMPFHRLISESQRVEHLRDPSLRTMGGDGAGVPLEPEPV